MNGKILGQFPGFSIHKQKSSVSDTLAVNELLQMDFSLSAFKPLEQNLSIKNKAILRRSVKNTTKFFLFTLTYTAPKRVGKAGADFLTIAKWLVYM